MSKVVIQPDYRNFDMALDIAKQHDYNLEIVSFANSRVLDSNWEELLNEYKRKLQNFQGSVSMHGVFMEIYIYSTDSKIREVAKHRIYHCLEIANKLNAQYVIFHGNYNPLIRHERYKRIWLDAHASFWSEVTSEHDFVVLIENHWDPTPEIFRSLLNEVNSPRLKVCLDTGHTNIYSRVPFKDWIDALGEDIPYMHVNDNLGDVDSGLPPGEGNIDWKVFSDTIEEANIHPQIVFELNSFENTTKSIDYFQREKIYPFNIT